MHYFPTFTLKNRDEMNVRRRAYLEFIVFRRFCGREMLGERSNSWNLVRNVTMSRVMFCISSLFLGDSMLTRQRDAAVWEVHNMGLYVVVGIIDLFHSIQYKWNITCNLIYVA